MIPPPPGIGISRAWITRGRDLQAKIVQTKPSSPSKPNHPSVMSIYSLTYCIYTEPSSFPASYPNSTVFSASETQLCFFLPLLQTQQSFFLAFPSNPNDVYLLLSSKLAFPVPFLHLLYPNLKLLSFLSSFFPSHSYLDSAERNKIVSPINHYFE